MPPRPKPAGEIRQSQLVTIFGPGAMMDLPDDSVLISGLQGWSPGGTTLREPRLARKLAHLLKLPAVELRTPPPYDPDPRAPSTGVSAFLFPEWFVTRDIQPRLGDTPGRRSRFLVPRLALYHRQFQDQDRKRWRVVPIRFVRACPRGHIADIDWYDFVHRGQAKNCRLAQRQLYVDEQGTSSDLSEESIRCDCGASRQMVEAAKMELRPFGACQGERPWLGPYSKEHCGEPSRLLIRSASNAYFSERMSVISLPERDQAAREAVDQVLDFLELAQTVEDVRHERRKAKVSAALEGFTDEEVLADLAARNAAPAEKSVKLAELETLMAVKPGPGALEDKPDSVFSARVLPDEVWRPADCMAPIERVVLVSRLREVVAQAGFSRFEPLAPDIQGDLDLGVKRAALATETKWLPAYENKGEGIYLQFRQASLNAWLAQPDSAARQQKISKGFAAWRAEHPGSARKQHPGMRYLLLHSFSHLLVGALALRCGYPASAIRERIYCIDGVGYGVLLYTGATDAEGTLGGLVEVGERIHEVVREALELGRLCSNDPVCAQHDPADAHERRFLAGAACHGCLLIAETSCEQYNDFLDRACVVPTLADEDTALFAAGWDV
ncbi:MAG: DrmB family protein [Terriglobales bacterium]